MVHPDCDIVRVIDETGKLDCMIILHSTTDLKITKTYLYFERLFVDKMLAFFTNISPYGGCLLYGITIVTQSAPLIFKKSMICQWKPAPVT